MAGRVDPEDYGRETIFSLEEERKLVEHIQLRAELGYGLSNASTQRLAGEMAYEMKRRKTNTPMSNNWLYSFLKRWESSIRTIKPRQLDSARAKSSTPEAFNNYFTQLKAVLEENNLLDKPHRIYNVDETGLQPEHKPPKVIGNPNTKIQAITSPRSTTTTVIACVNAFGHSLPPFFIFKGKRWNPELMKGACFGAKGIMSETGWSNGEIFRKFLEEHFLPFVGSAANNGPILLIYDGHASHKTYETIRWAREKGIILFVLPAHSSHLLQPLDVAVFGPFKRHYYSECAKYLASHMGMTITRHEICSLASRAYLKSFTLMNIQAGFKKTGIFPLNMNIVAADKLFPCESFREAMPFEKLRALKAGPDAVAKFLKQKEENINIHESEKDNKQDNEKEKVKPPNPSGKVITNDAFISQLTCYINEKTKNDKCKPKRKKISTHTNQKRPTVMRSPKPSTSGLQINTHSEKGPESDLDEDITDEEKCCVCASFSPPDLKKCQYLKIVSWGQCDMCNHWVHLSFCTPERVVRRQGTFLCPHCKLN